MAKGGADVAWKGGGEEELMAQDGMREGARAASSWPVVSLPSSALPSCLLLQDRPHGACPKPLLASCFLKPTVI